MAPKTSLYPAKSMFDTTCTLPLDSTFQAQALHPSESIVSVGLSSGHVQTYRLPALGETVRTEIVRAWQTRRHHGSCRSIGFSSDGEHLFSAGSDSRVKLASTETGQVVSKIATFSGLNRNEFDVPSVIQALSPQSLLVGFDSGFIHVYDLRHAFASVNARPQRSYRQCDDAVTSLTLLPPSDTSTSGTSKQWISTGESTLAVFDMRAGLQRSSVIQDEWLLSSSFVSGIRGKSGSKGEGILVGGDQGVMTLWKKGEWDDPAERIVVDAGTKPAIAETLDTLAPVPDALSDRKLVAVGLGSGWIKIVNLGINKVVGITEHDPRDSVLGLGFLADGRMVSGGGETIKVWQVSVVEDDEDDVQDSARVEQKRRLSSDSDSDRDGDEEHGDEDGSVLSQVPKRRPRKKVATEPTRSHKAVNAKFNGLD